MLHKFAVFERVPNIGLNAVITNFARADVQDASILFIALDKYDGTPDWRASFTVSARRDSDGVE